MAEEVKYTLSTPTQGSPAVSNHTEKKTPLVFAVSTHFAARMAALGALR